MTRGLKRIRKKMMTVKGRQGRVKIHTIHAPEEKTQSDRMENIFTDIV
jgi:hypothetical protein